MNFISDLDQYHKILLLLGGFQLPFDDIPTKGIERFVAATVEKIYKIRMRTEKLRELGAPWSTM